MTVIHIAPTPFHSDRGCHIRIAGMVRCLSMLGHQSLVCTYHHGDEFSGVNTSRIKPIKRYTKTEAGPSKYKLWADWRLLWLVVKETWRRKPVVIHAHLHEGVFIGLVVKWLLFWRTISLVADIQGSLTGELDSYDSFKKAGLLRPVSRILEKLLMKWSDIIICSSKKSLDMVEDQIGTTNGNLFLVEDGADPIDPISATQNAQLRSKFGLPENRIIAIYSGALLPSKGLNELKKLILSTADRFNLYFLVIGYPIENLTDFIEENNLQSRCSLTGRIRFSELPGFLSVADIAIEPKQSTAGEGSGKLLNYIAAGLPVVAFATTNNFSFLPADTLLADNSDELTSMLLRLLDDETLRKQESAKNKHWFMERFSWETSCQQLRLAYQHLPIFGKSQLDINE